MRRIIFVLSIAVAGCRAASPTPSLNLTEGPFHLAVVGYSFSQDPSIPPCVPFGVPKTGTQVDLAVTVSRQGADWIIRDDAARPDRLELRFKATGGVSNGGDSFVGTATGSAKDAGDPPASPPVDVEMTIAANPVASLSGEVTTAITQGKISGAIQFRDSSGNMGSCSVVVMFLRNRR